MITLRTMRSDRRGNALVEFALVLPLFMMFAGGTMQYAYWLYISSSLQAVANDAARASLAGMSATERATLANARVTTDIAAIRGLSGTAASTAITDDGTNFRIQVNYNQSQAQIASFGPIPMPPGTITRSAIVALSST